MKFSALKKKYKRLMRLTTNSNQFLNNNWI